MVLSTRKLAYNEDEFQVLSVVRRLVDPTGPVYKQLSSDPIPPTRKKYNHLQELKISIPPFFHPYYDMLPVKINATEKEGKTVKRRKEETATGNKHSRGTV